MPYIEVQTERDLKPIHVDIETWDEGTETIQQGHEYYADGIICYVDSCKSKSPDEEGESCNRQYFFSNDPEGEEMASLELSEWKAITKNYETTTAIAITPCTTDRHAKRYNPEKYPEALIDYMIEIVRDSDSALGVLSSEEIEQIYIIKGSAFFGGEAMCYYEYYAVRAPHLIWDKARKGCQVPR